MSERHKRAAAELTQAPVADDADRDVRRDVAVDLLGQLYIEVQLFAGLPLNKKAAKAILRGKAQYHLLDEGRIATQFGMIEDIITQSTGLTYEQKLISLFEHPKEKIEVYGEAVIPFYLALRGTFETAVKLERVRRIQDTMDNEKQRRILAKSELDKADRKWFKRLRRERCGPN